MKKLLSIVILALAIFGAYTALQDLDNIKKSINSQIENTSEIVRTKALETLNKEY